MLLTELLSADRVRVPLAARSKEAVLEELVAVLAEAGVVDDAAATLAAVRRREAAGLWVAAGVAAEPLDFDSLDGEPVRLLFLLVGPESAAGLHVKALSRISRLVRREETRARLAAAPSPEAFMAVVAEAEAEGA